MLHDAPDAPRPQAAQVIEAAASGEPGAHRDHARRSGRRRAVRHSTRPPRANMPDRRSRGCGAPSAAGRSHQSGRRSPEHRSASTRRVAPRGKAYARQTSWLPPFDGELPLGEPRVGVHADLLSERIALRVVRSPLRQAFVVGAEPIELLLLQLTGQKRQPLADRLLRAPDLSLGVLAQRLGDVIDRLVERQDVEDRLVSDARGSAATCSSRSDPPARRLRTDPRAAAAPTANTSPTPETPRAPSARTTDESPTSAAPPAPESPGTTGASSRDTPAPSHTPSPRRAG
jgi:hypothetical protein